MNVEHLNALESRGEMRLSGLETAEWDKVFWDILCAGRPSSFSLDLEGADLYGYHFVGPRSDTPLGRSNFRHANLSRTSWLWSAIPGADFANADLSGCKMESVRASGTIFKGADLTDATLRFFVLDGDLAIDFSEAKISHTTIALDSPCRFIMTGISSSPALKIVDVDDKELEKNIRSTFEECLPPELRTSLSVESVGQSKCFIASAAYGDPSHPDVSTLRQFRDALLTPSRIGQLVILVYERLSPRIATLVGNHSGLQSIVRRALRPIVGLADAALKRNASTRHTQNNSLGLRGGNWRP